MCRYCTLVEERYWEFLRVEEEDKLRYDFELSLFHLEFAIRIFDYKGESVIDILGAKKKLRNK